MSQVKWSRIETGSRAPTPEEFEALCRRFQLGHVFPRPENVVQMLRRESVNLKSADRVFIPPRDRSSYIRFRTALRKWPLLVNRFMSLVEQRSDYALVQHVCHNISFDSALENLYVQCLLANGAVPSLEIPYLQGHLPYPVIDPRDHREVGQLLHYCLKLNSAYHFFQISFKTFPSCRVDVLIRRNQRWEVLEINGAGHDHSKDQTWAARVGLPVHSLNQWEVERLAWSILEQSAA
jgi:hypothetical protein